jgi:hypothetical protein
VIYIKYNVLFHIKHIYIIQVKPTLLALQANPDMVAFKEMRQEVKERVIGALPGIPPGFTVCGKGELAVLGIHCAICAGIYSK